jgi:hypothetical protein
VPPALTGLLLFVPGAFVEKALQHRNKTGQKERSSSQGLFISGLNQNLLDLSCAGLAVRLMCFRLPIISQPGYRKIL